MQLAFPTRRSLAVLAASTIGLSTALLGTVGVASAATPPLLQPLHFDTNAADTGATTLHAGDPIDIPAGYCSIDWAIEGAGGGNPSDHWNNPGFGTEVRVTTPISGAQHYTFTLGAAGGDASTAGGTGGAGGHGANGTAGSDDGTGTFGGGGGGATTVDNIAGLLLEAPGGDGANTTAGTGGGPGGGSVVTPSGVTPVVSQPGAGSGVQATANPCAPAPAVSYLEGGDRSADFTLVMDTNFVDPIYGTQYSVDGGATWTNVAASTGDDVHYRGTLTGLATGHAYSVQFRFVSQAGPGLASTAKSVTTWFPAPTNLKATAGTSSITFTWSPPADATGVTGYTAWAIPDGAQSSGMMIPCPAMDATVHTCTVTVPTGRVYWVGVAALGVGSDRDYPGMSAFLKVGAVPPAGGPGTSAVSAPTAVPTGSGHLTSGTGPVPTTLTAGQQVPLSGSGYAPNSAVSLYVYSPRTLLLTVTTNAQGSFSTTVTIPTGLAPGARHLIGAGVDRSGNPRYLRSDVTVTTPSGQLAWTGFEPMPFVLTGGLAVLLGIVLLVVGRRRRTA